MAVAKGRIASNKQYIYTCGHCGGAGLIGDEICTHCYDLKLDALFEAFATARGERYYALLKAILSVQGQAICQQAEQIIEETDCIRVIDVVGMFIDFDWPRNRWKPFVEWLEEAAMIQSGTYRQLKDGGFKIGKTIEKLLSDGLSGEVKDR